MAKQLSINFLKKQLTKTIDPLQTHGWDEVKVQDMTIRIHKPAIEYWVEEIMDYAQKLLLIAQSEVILSKGTRIGREELTKARESLLYRNGDWN